MNDETEYERNRQDYDEQEREEAEERARLLDDMETEK